MAIPVENVINDTQWHDTLLIVRSSVAVLALLSCLLVLLLAAIFALKDAETCLLPTVRIALYITLASIIRSIIIIVQVSPVLDHSLYIDDTYCIITGYLYRSISMIAILFTLIATIHTLLVMFGVQHTWKFELGYVLVPIILPLLYTWIPFAYDKALLQVWCLVNVTGDTQNELINGIIYNNDIPCLIIEALNTILIIVVFCRILFTYCKNKCEQGKDFIVHLKQVLPILIHSVFYLAMNWFSLSDHLNYRRLGYDELESNLSRSLQMAHSITSAGRGIVVGIVFTAYFLIMLYISWKHHGDKTAVSVSKRKLSDSSVCEKDEEDSLISNNINI